MPIEVELPDGVIAEFPDEMSPEDIKSVLRRKFPTVGSVTNQQPFEIPYSPGMPYGAPPPGPPEQSGRLGAFGEALREIPAPISQALHYVMQPVEKVAAPLASYAGIGMAAKLAKLAAGAPPETIFEQTFKPGESVIPGLEPPAGSVGFLPSLRRFVAGATTPGMLATAPVAGPSRLLTGAFALGGAASIPPAIAALGEAQNVNEASGALMDIGLGSLVTAGAGRATFPLAPEVPITVTPRFDLAQMLENQVRARSAAEAGSPFVRMEVPPEVIGMGVRTQPPLSMVFDPQGRVVGDTFEPSGLQLNPELQPGVRGLGIPQELQPPGPPMAPGPRPTTASRVIRLQGEAAQRMADFEKAMSEKVAQEQQAKLHPDKPLTENQLRIIQESLVKQILEGQIPGERSGIISGSALEKWADKTLADESWRKNTSMNPFGAASSAAKNTAAMIVKGAAVLERGIVNSVEWAAEMIREFGPEIKPWLQQIRQQSEQARNSILEKGGEQNAIQREANAVLRNVQQPEVAQEGAGRVPASEGRPQAPEARKENVTEQNINNLTPEQYQSIRHDDGIRYGLTLKESDVPRLQQQYDSLKDQMVKAFESGDSAKQIEVFGKANFFGGALMGATRGTHPVSGSNFSGWIEKTKIENPDIAKTFGTSSGLEFRGETTIGGKAYNFHDPVSNNSVTIKSGTSFKDAMSRVETVRAQEPKGGVKRGLQEKGQEKEVLTEPTVEQVTPLDVASGRPLTAFESLIQRLEAAKFPEVTDAEWLNQGTELMAGLNLPHPEVIKAVGRDVWNKSVDLTIEAVKAGKSAAEAIEDAIKFSKGKTGFNEEKLRKNLQVVTRSQPALQTPPSMIGGETKPPVEPAKMVTEKEARSMEAKVKLPSQKDVETLTQQIDLFNKEIGDALESGGQFLPKELRPEVAKGTPAEAKTVTNKAINQYFVNKLSTLRKQIQVAKNKIAQQADPESLNYFDLLQKRFEQAFRQVQELRRASHESLYFWNKIRAEYQDIARAAGAMPEMKKQLPIINQIIKDVHAKDYLAAGRHYIDFLRMNLFTPGSWTLDFTTNLYATASQLPTWAIMDMGALITGRPASRMGTAMRALADNMKNWNPLGKRFRLPEKIETELGTTAGAEFAGAPKQVMIDFKEYFPNHPELARQLNRLDYIAAGPVRMKRAVDGFFGRFGATAELYHRAYIEGRSRGLTGDELKRFTEDFVQNPSEVALERAIKTGKELKFNRDLSKLEEAFANNILTKLVIETFPRWTLQFTRWGGEMIGVNPAYFKKVFTGKATAEETVNYLVKAATGWGGIYAFNQLFYDNIDANSMEYVKEDGNRVRLAGRTPAPELFFINALLRGDKEKAKAALQYLSIPGAQMLSGKSGGLISPLFETIQESITGRYTAEQTIRELTKLVNNAIPGKSILGLIRSIYDPTVREGIGAPIPGVASLLPQRINPTTGEPLAPKQRIPGTAIEMPTVGGTPFPGAERVLNKIESTLLNHGLGVTRPRRTSIIDLPAEDVPKEVRQDYERMVGKNIQEYVGAELENPEFWQQDFETRREILSQLMSAARAVAKVDIADKHGAAGRTIPSMPLNIQRLPERLRK